MFDSDLLATACEYLAEYGVEPGQLAVVIASLTIMLGGKVSYRLGSMAVGYAWGCFAGALKWAFAKPPEPEASPALVAALKALEDDSAVFDPRDRALHCSGLRVVLHSQIDTVSVALAAPQQLKTGQWIGRQVKPLLKEGEWAKLTAAAEEKITEVIERDRVAANEDAARQMLDAQVALVEDGECKFGCGCAELKNKSK